MWELNASFNDQGVNLIADNLEVGVQVFFGTLMPAQAANVIAEWQTWHDLRDAFYEDGFAADYTNKYFGSTTWEIAGVKGSVEYFYPATVKA